MTADERQEMKDSNGFSLWNPEYNLAVVVLARDGEHIRHTVIHELLHVRLQGHDYMPTKRSLTTEATINALAKALI
jgi:Zn-dependent peptidase ImmA (M78 family)